MPGFNIKAISAICENCGNGFSHAINDFNSRVRQYCGDCWPTTKCLECEKEFQYKRHAMEYEYSPKACGHCGKFYIPASGMSRYCSDECFRGRRNAKLREQTAWRPLVSSWCENCGISFQSKIGARFCTASCRSTFDRRKKGNYGLGSHRRRAEYYGCEYDETVTRVSVLIRDKWTHGMQHAKAREHS